MFKPLNPLKLFNKKKDFADADPTPHEEDSRMNETFEDNYGDTYSKFLEEEARKGKLKNSKILFYEKFSSKLKMYEYAEPPKNVSSKVKSLSIPYFQPEDQGHKCYNCGAELSKIMLLIKEKSFFCHYTGHWYCYDCMAKEKALIPWYVRESFDFKQYHVSKTSYEELRKLFNKPIIQIEYLSNIVQKNKILYDTLVGKVCL